MEERADAFCRRMQLAREGALPRALGLAGGKRDVHDAGLRRALDHEAGRREDLQHLVVLAEDVGLEVRDAARTCDRGQVLEEDGADPTTLMRIGDGERDLGRMPPLVHDGVAPDADDVLLAMLEERRNERHAPVEVEARELVELGVREAPLGAEEAEVDRARAQAVEVIEEPLAVVRPDRADVDRAAVAEDGLGGVLTGVGDRGPVARAEPAWRDERVGETRPR